MDIWKVCFQSITHGLEINTENILYLKIGEGEELQGKEGEG